MRSWNSSLNGFLRALARSTQAAPSTLRRRAMPRSWRSLSSIGLALQEVEHGVCVSLWLLEVGDMRAVDDRKLGTLDLALDFFTRCGRRRGVVLPDDHQRRHGDARIACAEIHVADRRATRYVAFDRRRHEHPGHP